MTIGTILFCNTSHQYDLYGVKKAEQSDEIPPSTAINVGYFNPSNGTEHATQQSSNGKNQIGCIPKVLLTMSKVEMGLENFIGAVWILYHDNAESSTSRILLAPIMIGVGSSVYAQSHYAVKAAERALQGISDYGSSTEMVTYKHQLQALVGLLGSILEGLKFYFTVLIVSPNNSLGNTLALNAGLERFVAFLTCKGHAATDVVFGKTMLGKIWYRLFACPIMPNLISYTESTMPLVGVAIHAQAVLVVFNMLQERFGLENNELVSGVAYVTAGLSGMMEALIVQKAFSCNKLIKYLDENKAQLEISKNFWYGKDDTDINSAQMAARFIKYAVNTLFVIPLSCLRVADQLLHFTTLLILSVLPVQLLASFAYVSRIALAYRMFYIAAQSAPGILQLYTGKDIQQKLSEDEQMLVALAGVFSGFALGYMVVMACGDSTLKLMNKSYRMGDESANNTQEINPNKALLAEDTPQYIGVKIRALGALRSGQKLFYQLAEDVHKLLQL